jgi:tetratricopeptide (TPR) repeat protein
MPEKIDGILPLEYYLAIIPIIIITITLFYKTSFHHIVTFGLIFFLLTISLSIHIIPFGKAIVSERYVYVPYVGIYFLLGQCSVWIMDRYKKAIVVQKYYVVWIIAAFVIAYFGYSTYKRIQVWNNTETLFRDAALKVNNNKTAKQLQAMGYELDGEERLNAQDYSKAIEYYNTSITLNPSKAKLYHDRGYAKHFSEDFEGAMKDYSKAIELDPTYVRAYANRAIIYLKWNKQQEACADLRAAYNLGLYNIYEMVPVNCQ